MTLCLRFQLFILCLTPSWGSIKGELSSFNTVYGQYRGLRGFTAFETVKSIRSRLLGRKVHRGPLIRLECLCSVAEITIPARKESDNESWGEQVFSQPRVRECSRVLEIFKNIWKWNKESAIKSENYYRERTVIAWHSTPLSYDKMAHIFKFYLLNLNKYYDSWAVVPPLFIPGPYPSCPTLPRTLPKMYHLMQACLCN